MNSHCRRCSSLITGVVAVLTALPVLAQQAAPRRLPAQAPANAPQRATQRPAAPRTQNTDARSGKAAQYPVRQAAANEVAPAPQPGAPKPNTGAIAPQAPFQLTPAEQGLLDQILAKWEQQSNRISTFTCKFGRWEVNETFGPAEHHYVLSEAHGEIKFKAPDHGAYIVSDQTEWDKGKNAYSARTEGLDHWVCDGKSIFEYNNEKKQLIERQLDPSMQGKAITDGPLPFVFGTKADQLKRRYWMKDITPAEDVNKKIWLEAWPKFQRDAANFQHAIIVLNQRDFMPSALRIILPDGKNKQDYSFEGTSVNNPIASLTGAFMAPRTPFGWTKVVIPAGGEQVPPPQGAPPAQAQQPRAGVQRQ